MVFYLGKQWDFEEWSFFFFFFKPKREMAGFQAVGDLVTWNQFSYCILSPARVPFSLAFHPP